VRDRHYRPCLNAASRRSRPKDDFVKTVKRKAKSAALVWKEFGLTAGYHSHAAPAAKGSYYIIPIFKREVFNGYVVSQLGTAMRGISAVSRGTAVLRNWTRPKLSRKRITTLDGIGE
jgi:hypothetical protein